MLARLGLVGVESVEVVGGDEVGWRRRSYVLHAGRSS